MRSRLVRPDGSTIVEMLPSDDFKRMAAQTAKQAVLRQIHDLERDKVLRDVAEHKGELASGIVDRIEAGAVYVDLGRAEGVMPPEEQIPGEQLHPGRPVLVVLLEAQRNFEQAQVRVSRAARDPSSTGCWRRRCRRSKPAPCRSAPSRGKPVCERRSRSRRASPASTRWARAWARRGYATAPSSASSATSISTSCRGPTSRKPSSPPPLGPAKADLVTIDRDHAHGHGHGAAGTAVAGDRPRRPERSPRGKADRMARRHQAERGRGANLCRTRAMSRSGPASAAAGRRGKRQLIRVVRRPAGGAALDPSGVAAGRGAYLHSDPACLENARKRRALDRALGTQVPPELWSELDAYTSPGPPA